MMHYIAYGTLGLPYTNSNHYREQISDRRFEPRPSAMFIYPSYQVGDFLVSTYFHFIDPFDHRESDFLYLALQNVLF